MKRIEYHISKHPLEELRRLVYFCTGTGECDYNQLPEDQMHTLENLLNDKGSQVWELVQIFFGQDGIAAFWKREFFLEDKQ